MATMLDSPATKVLVMASPGLARGATLTDARPQPQIQSRGRSLRRELEMQSPSHELARERQQRCFDEALAAAVAVASARSPEGTDGQLTPIRLLERRVDDMFREMSAQAVRIGRLEEAAPLGACGTLREEDRLQVSHVVGRLQEKEGELLRLMQDQQQELEKLRLQQAQLQATLIIQPTRTREDAEQTAMAATRALELQLRDLVGELKKLQQEQQVQNCRDAERALKQHEADAMSDFEMLQELREERALVTQMLEGVRSEKCEVIAMMHSFAMEKSDVLQELEALRKAAREDVTTMSLVRKESVKQPLSMQEASIVTKVMATRLEEEANLLSHKLPGTVGRDSRQSLCTSSNVTGAPRHLQQPGAPPAPATSQHPAQTASSQQLVPAAAAAYSVQQQRTMAGAGPSMQALDVNEQSVMRRCSPVRQYSAGVAPGFLPMSLQCSPTVVTRGADPLRLAPPTSMDTKKSPVRRFVSAGLSPRVLDTTLASPGWMSQTQLR